MSDVDLEKEVADTDQYSEHELHTEYNPNCSTCFAQKNKCEVQDSKDWRQENLGNKKVCLQTGCITKTDFAFCEEHEDPLGGDGIDD